MSIVHEGWLVNKITSEAPFMKAVASLQRKRRMWFVLRNSGEIPGQFVLEYFTDPSYRKLKGKIDLDQCQQVDAGIHSEATKKDDFIFALRTSKRVFHLAARTEQEMNKWVSSICYVCGFRPQSVDDESSQPPSIAAIVSPSVETLVNISAPQENSKSNNYSPYIPIFECFSGNPNDRGSRNSSMTEDIISLPSSLPEVIRTSSTTGNDFYDYPKPFHKSDVNEVHKLSKRHEHHQESPLSPQHPIYSNIDSPQLSLQNEVFIYDNVRPYSGDSASKEPQYFNISNNADNSKFEATKDDIPSQGGPSGVFAVPPPRPPKPHNLGDSKLRRDSNTSTESNAAGWSLSTSSPIKAYSNKNPLNSISDRKEEDSPKDLHLLAEAPLTPSSSTLAEGVYDFPKAQREEPTAESRTLRKRHVYSNAPAGFFNNKETVFNYEYRPGLLSNNSSPGFDSKKNSESSPTYLNSYANIPTSSPISLGGFFTEPAPPVIHRDLKPKRKESFGDAPKVLNLAPPPQGRNRSASVPYKESGSSKRLSPPTSDDEAEDQLKALKSEIQYLDLNLDSDSSVQSPKTPEKPSATIYKTVDFVKTKAFNVMRQNAEAYRKSQ